MTTTQILCLDYRKEAQRDKLLKFLYKIPQYSKYAEGNKKVPLDKLEKMLYTVSYKYAITLQCISYIDYEKEDTRYWSATFRNDLDYSYMEMITASELYELFAKIAIFCYAATKGYKGGLKTKEEARIIKEKIKNDQT